MGKKCVVCDNIKDNSTSDLGMCLVCLRSYDKLKLHTHERAIKWAAQRVRRLAKQETQEKLNRQKAEEYRSIPRVYWTAEQLVDILIKREFDKPGHLLSNPQQTTITAQRLTND
jgi:hypothetical protein